MRDLAGLTAADFEPLVGTQFVVHVADAARGPLVLRLVAVARLGHQTTGYRQPFSLRFTGPMAPLLGQAVHCLSHPALGDLGIFLGPVVPSAQGITYEAIFA